MKFFFSPLFEPLAMIWCAMVLACGWQLHRRQWRCAAWLAAPAFIIFLIGSTPLVDRIVALAEKNQLAYSNTDSGTLHNPVPVTSVEHQSEFQRRTSHLQECDTVLVLGGGYFVSDQDPFGFNFSVATPRVLTGVELVRMGKAKSLVLGGSFPARNRPDQTATMLIEDWLRSWNAVSAPITNLGVCLDTHEEALRYKALQDCEGWKSTILVTSALHLKRATALFRKQGIEVIPVACDFEVFGTVSKIPGYSPFPRLERFFVLSSYIHEKLGWWVYRVRGWI